MAVTAAIVPAGSATALSAAHTATFSGPYSTRPATENWSSLCSTGSTAGGVNDCTFHFPTPRNACIADPPGTPAFGKGTLTIGVYSTSVYLNRMGGGVFEGTGTTVDGTNTTVWFMHISVQGLCDDDLNTTIGTLLEPLTGAPSYQFSGYANA